MSAPGGAGTILRAQGAVASGPLTIGAIRARSAARRPSPGVDVLIRRLALVLLLLAGLAAIPAQSLADGRDILLDFDDNGQIDGCYTRAEFNEALELARADEQQYGAAVDIILEARVTNIDEPGQPCGDEQIPAAVSGEDDDGGLSTGVIIGIVIAVAALLAVGAALLARRRPSGPDAG